MKRSIAFCGRNVLNRHQLFYSHLQSHSHTNTTNITQIFNAKPIVLKMYQNQWRTRFSSLKNFTKYKEQSNQFHKNYKVFMRRKFLLHYVKELLKL